MVQQAYHVPSLRRNLVVSSAETEVQTAGHDPEPPSFRVIKSTKLLFTDWKSRAEVTAAPETMRVETRIMGSMKKVSNKTFNDQQGTICLASNEERMEREYLRCWVYFLDGCLLCARSCALSFLVTSVSTSACLLFWFWLIEVTPRGPRASFKKLSRIWWRWQFSLWR